MQKNLNTFRRQIDSIDKKLINLLKKRSLIINKVKELKEDIHPKINFARETKMAYRLQKKNFGYYKHEVMQKIWRELIFASLIIEGSLDIEVYNENTNVISSLWVLARDHFGTYSNLTCSSSIDDILNNLKNNTTSLAVLPFPTKEDSWWLKLKKYPELKICLSLPFLALPNNIKSVNGVILSKAKLEKSVNDISLFILETENLNTLNNIKPIASIGNQHIVLVNGFTTEENLISKFSNLPVEKVMFAGCYPKPVEETIF